MNRVFATVEDTLHEPPERLLQLREIAFAGEGPPREAAAETGQYRPADSPLTEALKGKGATADADEPPCHCESLAGAIPSTAVPHAFRSTMSCQVEFARVSHAPDRCKFVDIVGESGR